MDFFPAGGPRFVPPESYARKPAPADWAQDDVAFQLMDVKQHRCAPIPGMPGLQRAHGINEVTSVRMFGCNKNGNSVTAIVHGFLPYFWIQAPPGFQASHAEAFRQMLNQRAMPACNVQQPVVSVSCHNKMSLMHYQNNDKVAFLRITLQMPGFVPKLRTILEGKGGGQGIEFPALYQGSWSFMTYESNVLFELRTLIDVGAGGANWISCQAGSYMPILNPSQRHSTSQIEFAVSYENLRPHDTEGDWASIAPLRILSFDIECQGRPGKFPEAEHDPVIQIAACVKVLGDKETLIDVVFCLKKTAPIPGIHLHCFESEKDLLLAFADFHRKVDADVITGYNIVNFDFPYLLDRAKTLNVVGFPFLSRVKDLHTTMRQKVFQNKAYGKREYQEFELPGMVLADVLIILQREHKLRSYTLNNVANHFLGEQKEDVHHSIIAKLQNGDDTTRNRLARYCYKDALLPMRLIDKLLIVVNLVEMARVTGVPCSWLIDKGQQIKVHSQILRQCIKEDILFPTVDSGGQTDESYEGATVIEPVRGFYDYPIATLDFASLYPSIMMAHNLCYSTLVGPEHIAKHNLVEGDDYVRAPSGGCFVKSTRFHGLLPRILRNLLAARKVAKKAMAAAKDPFESAVYNGRQLALKISANSVYGFTGATVGKLPCIAISRAVTAFGREMIDTTLKAVEKRYTIENGYEANAKVIYGDTDSVMIAFGKNLSMERAMELGHEAAEEVTKLFVSPVKLEFEKCYLPYLLMNKKRYAGLLWTRPEKHDKIDVKGIEAVRRDNCRLVSNMVTKVLHTILLERSVDKAVAYVKQTISDLLMNRLDISHLVISKTLTMTSEEYAGKQAHSELVDRMRARDPGSAPSIGERVPYVIVKATKNAKAFEKSEDPLYVLEKNLPIDSQHYLDHQFKKPLLRLFDGIINDAEATLLRGAHTRKVHVPTPKNTGLMKFAKVVLSCIGCKSKLTSATTGPLCDSCKPNEAEIYAAEVAKRNYYGKLFAKVWAQCQRCQGSLHEEVLCTNRDCDVFYMRKKVQIDLDTSQKTVDRFGELDW